MKTRKGLLAAGWSAVAIAIALGAALGLLSRAGERQRGDASRRALDSSADGVAGESSAAAPIETRVVLDARSGGVETSERVETETSRSGTALAALTGRVTLAGAGAVEGARIELAAPDGVSLATASAADGSFAFEALATRASYRLVVEADGDLSGATLIGVVVPPQGRHVEIELERRGASSVDGLVTDPSGRPLEGLLLRVRRADGEGEAVETSTDARGRFSIEAAPSGSLVIESRPEWRRGSLVVSGLLAPAGERLLCELVAGVGRGVLAGTVTRSGAPVQGAPVRLEWSSGGEGPRVDLTLRARTDADGRFAAEGLGAGLWTVRVQIPGLEAPARQVEVREGEAVPEVVIAVR